MKYFFPGVVSVVDNNSVIEMSSALYQNRVKISDKNLVQELRQLLSDGGCEFLDSKLKTFLNEQKMLVEENEILDDLQKVKKTLDKVLVLTIMPTECCNFRCVYCYEEKNNEIISGSKLMQLEKYIRKRIKEFECVNICWFGGEPTLCKDIVVSFTKSIKKIVEENGKKFTSGMTTNGYLLDDNSFIEYYNAGITTYQITMDGFKHDKLRMRTNGEPTFDTIKQNLINISKLSHINYSYRIVLRHNLTANDEEYSWYEYLYTIFEGDDRFTILNHTVDDWGGDGVKKLDIASEDKKKMLLEKHNSYAKEVGLSIEGEKELLFSNICHACYTNGMVIRSNGNIEKCTIALGNEKNIIGFIDENKGIVCSKNGEEWVNNDIERHCLKCSKILTCFNLRCGLRRVTLNEPQIGCRNFSPMKVLEGV